MPFSITVPCVFIILQLSNITKKMISLRECWSPGSIAYQSLWDLALPQCCLHWISSIIQMEEFAFQFLMIRHIVSDTTMGISPGNFTIPCGRGRDNYSPILVLGYTLPCLTTPIVIVSTMTLMYTTVNRIEKRNQSYGVHSLRQRIQQRSSVNDNLIDRLGRASVRTPPNHLSRRDYILSMRLDRASNNKRSIMHMAMGYALTWILTWAPMIMYISVPSHFTGFLVSGISPLQGFFNIIVYMAPKVRNAKKSKRQKITWPQAIWKVWTSKGDRRVTRGLTRQNATRRVSVRARVQHYESALSSKQSIPTDPTENVCSNNQAILNWKVSRAVSIQGDRTTGF